MSNHPSHPFRKILPVLIVMALVAVSCGDGDAASTTTTETTVPAVAETTTTVAETTTTAGETTTTSGNTAELDFLLDEGYTISDDYVVETVIRDIDSGTGGLAIGDDGVIYQADFGYPGHVGNSVYRILPDGTVETLVQSDDMESLTMTTFGADGKLYQTSWGNGNVFSIADDGTATLVAEGINGPTGIVVLEDGTKFVAGHGSGIIHRISPDGTITDWATHPDFNGMNSLTIGPDGTLYVANHSDGGLFSVDEEGTVTTLNEFPWQTSHVTYLDGGLFVTVRGILLIYRYDLETGESEIIAGNTTPGDDDGRGIESSFGRPNAITVGPDGNLYFNHADGSGNNVLHIRRIVYQP